MRSNYDGDEENNKIKILYDFECQSLDDNIQYTLLNRFMNFKI